MNSIMHFATCQVWTTGSWDNCTCVSTPAWRIRKETGEVFPWRIWRRTDDDNYEHLMRCSTFEGAISLVSQFIWLGAHAMHRQSNV